MRTSRRAAGWPAAVAALLLAPRAASGDDAPTGAGSPFTVAIQVDATGPAARYVHDPQWDFMSNPAITVDVAGQARAAYVARAGAMFLAAGRGDPALRLEVRVTAAAVEGGPGRWRAVVRHEVVARGRDGAEIARWATSGEGDVVGFEAESVTSAFARAARSAARELERRFDASSEVEAWRTANGYAPRAAAAGEAPSEGADPPRPPWIGYVDGALAMPGGSVGLVRAVGIGLRAGAAHDPVYLHVAVDQWGTVEGPSDNVDSFGYPTYPTTLTAWLVGVEAGALHRFGHGLEVRAGLGAYWLQANTVTPRIVGAYYELQDVVVDRGGVVGSVGAGLHYVTPPQSRLNVRGRIGLDVRRLFGATFPFEPLGGDITVARWLGALVAGVEFPAAARR